MSRISTENAALKFLLSVVAIRTAPKRFAEIIAGSNTQIGNVCYIHPDELPAVGVRAVEGIQQFSDFRTGALSLIVATRLMPRNGVIFAPLCQAVLDQFGEDAEVYRKMGFNVTREGGTIINAESPRRLGERTAAGIEALREEADRKMLGDGKVIDG